MRTDGDVMTSDSNAYRKATIFLGLGVGVVAAIMLGAPAGAAETHSPAAGHLAVAKPFPKLIQGPFSGSVVKDGVSLQWHGVVKLKYAGSDSQGLRYAVAGGSYVWSVSGTSANGCTHSGGSTVMMTSANTTGDFIIGSEKSQGGWPWQVLIGPDVVTPATFPVNVVCADGTHTDTPESTVGTSWTILYNSHNGSTHPVNVHSRNLVKFTSNSVNDQGSYKQQWIMSLKGTGHAPKR
jgi:hypothetical protein